MILASNFRFAKLAATRSGITSLEALMIRPAMATRATAASGYADHFLRSNSTIAAEAALINNVSVNNTDKSWKVLDSMAVERIKQELAEVDKNSDGRLDADELKTLLRKHKNTFSDSEIVELSEVYYAVKAGGSVPFANFIEAIDRVAEKGEAAKKITNNPIGIRQENLEYYNIGKPHSYTEEELNIDLTHRAPEGMLDKFAFYSVQAVRKVFDAATGWRMDNIRVDNTLNRVIYLETIAAVPGMVAAVVRHFRSLRQMKSDGGMLQMFLEEANNER